MPPTSLLLIADRLRSVVREACKHRFSFLAGYFHSGWAFLVPYVAVYGVYGALNGPVHDWSNWLPPLLGVTRCLHAFHLALGVTVLWSQLRGANGNVARTNIATLIRPLIPWLGMALLFGIPGVYLEFPGDPWQHLGRLNEWRHCEFVTNHSTWRKFSYFLGYSLIEGTSPPLVQLRWFNFYYTACCLLLCWQYYRLARACGLGDRAALLFVLLQAVLAGNNVFGFYRYYGMSSSLFAQLGAVTTIRLAVEWASAARAGEQLPHRAFLLVAAPALSGVILFNHVQGLGLVVLGISGVIVWRIVAQGPRAAVGLFAAVLLANLVVWLWFPRHPLLGSIYRTDGWLSPWLGFNLLEPGSAAFERSWVILGAAGAINLVAGFILLRRNHIVGWLTVFPVIALCMPACAIPFANALAAAAKPQEQYIIVFHRMLFAIPPFLAVAAVGEIVCRQSTNHPMWGRWAGSVPAIRSVTWSVALLFLLLPFTAPSYNRLYHSLVVPAADLAMIHVLESPVANATEAPGNGNRKIPSPPVLAMPGIGYVLAAVTGRPVTGAQKSIPLPAPAAVIEGLRPGLLHLSPVSFQSARIPTSSLYSPRSAIGAASGHWPPTVVALAHCAQDALFTIHGDRVETPELWLEWRSATEQTFQSASGTGHTGVEPRAAVPMPWQSQQPIRAGEALILRPVMRTFDNRGISVTFLVAGPGLQLTRDHAGQLQPFASPQWVYWDQPITFPSAGRYQITILGRTAWPEAEYAVRYEVAVEDPVPLP